MTLASSFPFVMLALGFGLVLSACAQRIGSAPKEPMVFIAAQTKLLSNDIVEITASVAHPSFGVPTAYADCVGAQYALIRGMKYASRLTSEQTGHADIVSEKTSYLLSRVAPGGKNVLNATEIVQRCKANQIPTV